MNNSFRKNENLINLSVYVINLRKYLDKLFSKNIAVNIKEFRNAIIFFYKNFKIKKLFLNLIVKSNFKEKKQINAMWTI